jgi:hypothetical protein
MKEVDDIQNELLAKGIGAVGVQLFGKDAVYTDRPMPPRARYNPPGDEGHYLCGVSKKSDEQLHGQGFVLSQHWFSSAKTGCEFGNEYGRRHPGRNPFLQDRGPLKRPRYRLWTRAERREESHTIHISIKGAHGEGHKYPTHTGPFYNWVKKLGQWHLSASGQPVTLCGAPMMGNNYTQDISPALREKCGVCWATAMPQMGAGERAELERPTEPLPPKYDRRLNPPEDDTEEIRRAMVQRINEIPVGRKYLTDLYGKNDVWDTDELRRDFDVVSFMAPFVMVRRKSDGATGSLTFQHSPRFYFSFQLDNPCGGRQTMKNPGERKLIARKVTTMEFKGPSGKYIHFKGTMHKAWGFPDGSAFVEGNFSTLPAWVTSKGHLTGMRLVGIEYKEEEKARREGLSPTNAPWVHDFSHNSVRTFKARGGLVIKAEVPVWEMR